MSSKAIRDYALSVETKDISEQVPVEDHRVESARRKRIRMRAHLLTSVLSVYPGDDPTNPVVIDDVIRHADVARGTFYKYFDSLEQAVEQLGSDLADELTNSYADLYEAVHDPRIRVATGFQLFLSRAAIDRNWGSFVSHLTGLRRDTRLLGQVKADLEAGVATGDFEIPDMDAAIDLVIGATVEGIRRVMTRTGSRHYIENYGSLILRSLGLSRDNAESVSKDASARLHREGAERLPWWLPFD